MALLLTEEQTMLRDSARSFMSDHAPVAQLRALRDSQDALGYSPQVWTQFAEMGFTGVLVPETQGGLGLGFVEAGVVMEEIGRNLTASPFLASGVVAVTALRHSGDAAQQGEWLPRLASGERLATLAIDEQAKHQPERVSVSARRDSNGWQLDGRKTFVIDGHVADLLIVVARTAPSGITLFGVPRDAQGVSVEAVRLVDSRIAARVSFNTVRLSDAAVVGPVDGAEPALKAALDAGRACAAAEMVGIADAVFSQTTEYLKARRQFGKFIGEFQALQHRAAVLYFDIELARAATLGALQALDQDPASASRAVSVAKARAGSSATLAVQEGVQMHGGMGMTDAFDIGLYMKRVRTLSEYFGDSHYHGQQLALGRGY